MSPMPMWEAGLPPPGISRPACEAHSPSSRLRRRRRETANRHRPCGRVLVKGRLREPRRRSRSPLSRQAWDRSTSTRKAWPDVSLRPRKNFKPSTTTYERVSWQPTHPAAAQRSAEITRVTTGLTRSGFSVITAEAGRLAMHEHCMIACLVLAAEAQTDDRRIRWREVRADPFLGRLPLIHSRAGYPGQRFGLGRRSASMTILPPYRPDEVPQRVRPASAVLNGRWMPIPSLACQATAFHETTTRIESGARSHWPILISTTSVVQRPLWVCPWRRSAGRHLPDPDHGRQ